MSRTKDWFMDNDDQENEVPDGPNDGYPTE
jgi:hypothetical protein